MTKGRRLLPALFISIATFAAAEGARWAALAALVCGLLLAGLMARRLQPLGVTAASALVVGWLGPVALPLFVLAALLPILGASAAVGCSATVLLAAEWAPKMAVLAAQGKPSATSALAIMVAPVLAASGLAFAMPREARARALGRIFSIGGLCGAAIWGLCQARWIGADLITAPVVRLALAFGFATLCSAGLTTSAPARSRAPVLLAVLMLLSAAGSAAVASRGDPVASVIFDEAHGDWASVSLALGPDDFGRNTTYSWRALANLLEASGVRVERRAQALSFEPPPREALYVLKMPLEAIEPAFAQALLEWVAAGGRLLVVADHTDLFDTAQNLNEFLAPLNIRIAPTAVFDRLGQPPVAPRAHWAGADWLRASADHRYLTGSSFEVLPWWALPVHTYGMSFAEQAVYFKANRFGYFQPDLVHPYGNHIAVAMLAHGKGAIQVWLDSTHWSTFTAFQSTYQDAFWQTMRRSGLSLSPKIYRVALLASSVLAAALLLWPRPPGLLTGGLALAVGVTLGSVIAVRLVEGAPAGAARMVEAVLGSAASAELLTPIVESASRNYSRALTSLQKWSPVRLHASATRAVAASAGPVLLVDPSTHELPAASRILEWVETGRRVVILSDPRVLTASDQQRWWRELGFVLRAERGLSEERDASSDLLGRREPAMARHAVLRFSPLDTSPWTETESTHLAQAFVLRPSVHRATHPSGVLVLSSRSEQFSDAAMGDVWDGVPVDDVSRAREHELARLVVGDQAVRGLRDAQAPRRGALAAAAPSALPNRFIVVSQGQLQAEGTLSAQSPGVELSFAETPDAFAWRLREEAARFLPQCSLDASSGYCARTLVDSRLVEWLVVPRIDASGRVQRIELIHEGRFSGVRDGMNVLFE